MTFSRKFQSLMETTLADLTVPSYAWLVFAVCTAGNPVCGWNGWILDGVFGTEGKVLPFDDTQT
jgi:hypothetical protein